MRILLVGGTGFIGRELYKALKDKHDVTASAHARVPNRMRWTYMDITQRQAVDVSGFDLVYHLAAYGLPPKNRETNLRLLYQTNVLGTINVMEECLRRKVRCVLVSSYSAKYLDSNYSVSKRAQEQIAKNFIKRGLDCIIVRLSSLYGPNQPEGFIVPDFTKKIQKNPKLLILRGSGKDVRNFMYIEDAVDALISLGMKGNRNKIYELGSDDEITTLELAKRLCKVMGVKPRIEVEKPVNVSPSTYSINKGSNFFINNERNWKAKWTLEKGLKEYLKKRNVN